MESLGSEIDLTKLNIFLSYDQEIKLSVYAKGLETCELKEVNLKRLNNVRFQLHDILEKTKLWR